MSWARAYRLALHLLPGELRRKHGPAMETLFEREVERARERGSLHGVLAGVAGIGDVVWRALYELVRPGRGAVAAHGDHPAKPRPTTGQLMRRHAASFAIAFVVLTGSLLVLFTIRQLPALTARGASATHVVLLAIPFTAALTIPMAVFVAVLREFTRLGADGALAAARRQRDGVRRLVVPVLAAAVLVAGLALLEVAEVVPRANTRLATLVMGRTGASSGRTMTLGQLREADRSARSSTQRIARVNATIYEVEIQKKFALPAACIVLALTGIAIALRIPRGGVGLLVSASGVVFGAYYILIITGETLATRLVVPPVVGMWGANVLLLAVALLAITHRAPDTSSEGETVVIDG